MSHIHDEDLRLACAGLLTGEDLLSLDDHLARCRDCSDRGLRLRAADNPPFADIEKLIEEAELSAVSVTKMLPRLKEAATALDHASQVISSKRLRILLGRVMFAQSWLLRSTGATNAAVDIARTAKEIFASEGDEFQRGRAALAECYALAEKMEADSASAAASEARGIFERLGDVARVSMAIAGEGHALVNAGRLREAREIYERLLADAPLTENSRTAYRQSLAVIMVRMGDLDGVDELLDAAEAGPMDRIVPQFSIRIRTLRAIVLGRRGGIEKALELLEELRRESEDRGFTRTMIIILCEMADLLTALGRHDEALPHAVAALEYFSREGVGAEFQRAIAISVVHEEMLRNASDVYRDLFRVRTAPGDAQVGPQSRNL